MNEKLLETTDLTNSPYFGILEIWLCPRLTEIIRGDNCATLIAKGRILAN